MHSRPRHDAAAVSFATAVVFAQPGEDGYDGRTQQHFKDETDINNIVDKFLRTGQLPENIRLPQYVDYEGIFDFRTAMETMMKAEEAFMEIPAPIRAQFDNSPQQYLEFCSNPDNRGKLKEMGLLRPEPQQPAPPEPPAPAGTSTTT